MGEFGDLFGFGKGFQKDLSIGAGIFSGLSGIGGMFGQQGAAQQQEGLLQLQEGQEEVGARQQGLQRARQVRQVMAQQTASAAAGGVESGSSSFQAVQRSSYNQFQEDNDIESLNITLARAKLAAQREMLENQKHGGMFSMLGSIAGIGLQIAGL